MKTHKHLHLARRKMSRIIDELYTALLHYGSGKVEMRILKKEDGLCLQIESDFAPEHIKHIRRMGELLQPAVRSPAMVEMYWELAGEDRYSSESEMTLVGQMADSAELTVDGNAVKIEITVAY
jgi:hypothetical protein